MVLQFCSFRPSLSLMKDAEKNYYLRPKINVHISILVYPKKNVHFQKYINNFRILPLNTTTIPNPVMGEVKCRQSYLYTEVDKDCFQRDLLQKHFTLKCFHKKFIHKSKGTIDIITKKLNNCALLKLCVTSLFDTGTREYAL